MYARMLLFNLDVYGLYEFRWGLGKRFNYNMGFDVRHIVGHPCNLVKGSKFSDGLKFLGHGLGFEIKFVFQYLKSISHMKLHVCVCYNVTFFVWFLCRI